MSTATPARDRAYQDTGCLLWRACLTCPLVRCIEEDRHAYAGLLALRNAVIRNLARRGDAASQIATRFGLSRRAVSRIIGGADGR